MCAPLFLSLLYLALLCLAGCAVEQRQAPDNAPAPEKTVDAYEKQRLRMVEEQIEARGVRDAAVLTVMRKVPRHRFVPGLYAGSAYEDRPLPIGEEQTISQPYIVAYMTEAAEVSKTEKVLEIGTGSGYQAAVLAELGAEVYTIEIIPELADRARRTLSNEGYKNVHVKTGNGYLGWPEHAPFDAILVTAAPDEVPPALVEQLAVGGKMVIPVGTGVQEMLVITKMKDGIVEKKSFPVRFVPMTGKPTPEKSQRR